MQTVLVHLLELYLAEDWWQVQAPCVHGMQARIANEVPAELVCEFLEVVTHEILYLRKIYTREIFERERLYGIVVHKSRHPELNLYVSDALLSLKVSSQASYAYL